jgi:predicted metalloendopeptidase
MSRKPVNDFYSHVNHKAIKKIKLHKGMTNWNYFSNNQRKINNILSVYPTDKNSPFLVTRDSKKLKHPSPTTYQPLLNQIQDIQNERDVWKSIYNLHCIGVRTVFGMEMGANMRDEQYMKTMSDDLKDIDLDLLYLMFSGMITDEKGEELSQKEIVKLFSLFGMTPTVNLRKFEDKLTSKLMSSAESRNILKTNNVVRVSESNALSAYFSASPKKVEFVVIDDLKWHKWLSKTVKDDLNKWKEYLAYSLMSFLRMFFKDTMVTDVPHKLYWTNLASVAYWQNAGEVYLQTVINHKEIRKRGQEMFRHIQSAAESCVNMSGMELETKRVAMQKIRDIVPLIGYTSKKQLYWFPIPDDMAPIEGDSFDTNIIKGFRFQMYRTLMGQGGYKTRNRWHHMGYHQVNAFYIADYNSVTIPISMFIEPFYTGNEIKDFSSIGRVMGHEITHAFDDQGRKVDENGKLRNWWTDRDNKWFTEQEKKTIKLVESYSIRNEHVNGKLVLGETIADMQSVQLTWIAMMKTLGRDPTKSEAKIYFKHFAKTRLGKVNLLEFCQDLENDPHPPLKIRVNAIFSSFEPFYMVYNVVDGDGMYVEPSKRPHFFCTVVPESWK